MSFTVTTGVTYSGGGVSVSGANQTHTGDAVLGFSVTVPAATTNGAVNQGVNIDVSTLKALVIKSDKAITLYTNAASTGAPADTLAIPANKPVLWTSNDLAACPLTTDVTAIYITNAGATSATVTIGACWDATSVLS